MRSLGQAINPSTTAATQAPAKPDQYGESYIPPIPVDTQQNNHPIRRAIGGALGAGLLGAAIAGTGGLAALPMGLGAAVLGGAGGLGLNREKRNENIKDQTRRLNLANSNNIAFQNSVAGLHDTAENQRKLTNNKAEPWTNYNYTTLDDAQKGYNDYLEYLKNAHENMKNYFTNHVNQNELEHPTTAQVTAPAPPPRTNASKGPTLDATTPPLTTSATHFEPNHAMDNLTLGNMSADPYAFVDPAIKVQGTDAATKRGLMPSQIAQNEGQANSANTQAGLNVARTKTEEAMRGPKVAETNAAAWDHTHDPPRSAPNPNETGTYTHLEGNKQIPLGAAVSLMNASQLPKPITIPYTAPGVDANKIHVQDLVPGSHNGQTGYFDKRNNLFYGSHELQLVTVGGGHGKKSGGHVAPRPGG